MPDQLSTVEPCCLQCQLLNRTPAIFDKAPVHRAYPSPLCLKIIHGEQWLLEIEFPLQNLRLVYQDTATIVCQHLSLADGLWVEIRRPGDPECRYTLTVLVRNQELGRVDVESKILKNLADIKIFIVSSKDGDHPDMDIGGLVVLKTPQEFFLSPCSSFLPPL